MPQTVKEAQIARRKTRIFHIRGKKAGIDGGHGVLPTPYRHLLQVHGNGSRPHPACDAGQTSVLCITHSVPFFRVRKDPFDRLFAFGIMWDRLQQSIPWGPTVCCIYFYFSMGLPERWDAEQMLDQYHLDEYHRIRPRPSCLMVIVWIQSLIQPVIVHDVLDLPKQMLFGDQCFDVRCDYISPRIFPPVFHDRTSIPILPETGPLV